MAVRGSKKSTVLIMGQFSQLETKKTLSVSYENPGLDQLPANWRCSGVCGY